MNIHKFLRSLLVLLLVGTVFLSAYILNENFLSMLSISNVNTGRRFEMKVVHGKHAARNGLDKSPKNGIHQLVSRIIAHKSNKTDTFSRTDEGVLTNLPPGTQMGKLQVSSIRRVINSYSNLLVWGLGNDSPFWHASTHGKVIFLEHDGTWYDKTMHKYPYLEAYKVKYTTHLKNSFDKYINNSAIWSDLDIRSQLPAVVVKTPWDVIIVDAPTGYFNDAPGRYQSIYTSLLLAKNGTHIFVDDYQRKVERQFSQKMLGTPVEVIKRPSSSIESNEQAHFKGVKY